jgi:predicted DNA binding CopG/RHH family protein
MTKTAENLPPILSRNDFETQEEYDEYLLLESDDFTPTLATQEQKDQASQVATNTVEKIAGKKTPIGLRVPERDLSRVKSLALQKGVPYQTLINSVLHQYLDGNLVEK